MRNWQSKRSIRPPCPGMSDVKSYLPYALLIADAKNPPKGATREANNAMKNSWM